ncbi:MAG: Kae1-associated serine/threonine protein kinase [Candidatus Thermoplasmatota archaeon]|nr:Kae1-associated serine/threonine protein kinase [Candidatus Thermoplasmatota archaeon]
MARLIQRGAEAEICLDTWLGRQVVVKRRVPKPYRIAEIDDLLRRQRTRKEVMLLYEARCAGVATPVVYDVDLEDMAITMQHIDGQRVKDVIDTLNGEEQRILCRSIGENAGRLHRGGIVHGDLTTSNLICWHDHIFFIDFGLGEKNEGTEQRGVDLHLLMEALTAAHTNPRLFAWVMEGYTATFPDAETVRRTVDDIASRGRYTVKP